MLTSKSLDRHECLDRADIREVCVAPPDGVSGGEKCTVAVKKQSIVPGTAPV